MNAARQISRRFGRATGARTRSASSDCIVGTVSFGPDPLRIATRVVDLLAKLGLSARMVDEDMATPAQLVSLLRTDIDWQSVENNLKT